MLDKKIKRVLGNIFSLSFLQLANYVLPLIVLPYLVQTLGAAKFGTLAFALAVNNYLSILVDFGFNLSATREIATNSSDKKEVSRVFNAVMATKVVLLGLALLLLIILCILFDRVGNEAYVYFFTFLMVVGRTFFPTWYFQGIEKMGVITVLNTIPRAIATILIFVLITESDDYLYVPLINSMGIVFGGLIALFIAIRDVKVSLPKLTDMLEVFRNSTSLFVSNLSISLFSSSNVLILGLFKDDHIVGIYAALEKLIVAGKGLFVPVFQGMFPWLVKKENKAILATINRLLLLIIGFTVPVFLIVYNYSEIIISTIYKDPDIVSNSRVLSFLSVIIVIAALNMLFNYLYLNTIKAYNERMKVLLISGLFNVSTGLLLVNFYGMYGITATFVMTELLLLVLGIHYFIQTRTRLLEPA